MFDINTMLYYNYILNNDNIDKYNETIYKLIFFIIIVNISTLIIKKI